MKKVQRKPRKGTRKSSKPERSITDEQIRTRAFELYQQRGAETGKDLDDWLQAEKELGLRA